MGVFGRFREKVLYRTAELARFRQHVFVIFGEGSSVVTGVGSERPWTFQSHQQ